MTPNTTERRRHARQALALPIELDVKGRRIGAEMQDLSPGGLRIRVDPSSFDYLAEPIDAVRLQGGAPLAVSVSWGLFDGTFGVAFSDPEAAAPIVTALLQAGAAQTAGA